MTIKYIAFICLCIFASCEKKAIYKLPESKMVNILADLHISEAAIANTNPAIKDSLANLYESQIFTIHRVSEKEFKDCLKQYQKDPAIMERIYKKVTEKLDERFH